MANGSACPWNEKKKAKNKPTDPLEDINQLSSEALEDTQVALLERVELTQEFLKEIEKEIQAALRMLKFLGDPWKRGDRTDYEFMRISLDKALTARKKERRERLLQSWKDTLDLRERIRELRKEVSALGSTDTNRESK